MPSTLDDDSPFIDWLDQQLSNRKWTQAELARQMGVQQSVIGNIVNKRVAMGVDVARRLANALELSQYEVFRVAGLIDEELLDDVKAAKEYLRLLAAIKDDDERQAAIDTVETILRRTAERRKADTSKRSGRTSAARSET